MNQRKKLNVKRQRRKIRVRARILGTEKRPRLSIFRSNRYTYAQLIDDALGKTLAAASTHEVKKEKGLKKIDEARALGKLIAEKAIKSKIVVAVVDRGAYKYHGRIKALVESAREAGLQI